MTSTPIHHPEAPGFSANTPVSGSDSDKSGHHPVVSPGDIAVGVVIGRASEYFDFFVYAIASVLVFPTIFFPFEEHLNGTLHAFVIFSFAFLARPFGTVIFMAIQKKLGGEIKLTLALFLLGTSTASIAFLPTYEQLGFTSILLLMLLRIGQGLALGGSWDGLPSLLALNVPDNKRGWYAMLGQLGAPVGFIVAGSVFAYLVGSLSSADFLEWGWRYPFFVAFAMNVVALFARLRLVVSEEYVQLLKERELEPTGLAELFSTQGRNIIIGAFIALGSYALFHLVTVFPLAWVSLYSLRSVSDFLVIQVFGAALMMLGIVVSGSVADRFGRRITLSVLAVLIAGLSGFVAQLINGGEVGQDAFILIGFTLLGLSYGQAAGAVSANFPSKYRYTGAALTSDLAWLIGAGFAPLVALGVSTQFGLAYVGLYLLSGAVCSLIALGMSHALK